MTGDSHSNVRRRELILVLGEYRWDRMDKRKFEDGDVGHRGIRGIRPVDAVKIELSHKCVLGSVSKARPRHDQHLVR